MPSPISCVPYYTFERGLDHVMDSVDRELYPKNEFPAGQWDYMRYYEESFAEAIASMDANVYEFVKLLFRKGIQQERGNERSQQRLVGVIASSGRVRFPTCHQTTTW
jgi:hypothetical protein